MPAASAMACTVVVLYGFLLRHLTAACSIWLRRATRLALATAPRPGGGTPSSGDTTWRLVNRQIPRFADYCTGSDQPTVTEDSFTPNGKPSQGRRQGAGPESLGGGGLESLPLPFPPPRAAPGASARTTPTTILVSEPPGAYRSIDSMVRSLG